MPEPLIAHVVHRLDYGGLENGLVNLLNRLPDTTGRHAVVCMTRASDFRTRLRRPDIPVYEIDKRPGKDPGAYLRLWRLLRHLRPALVHTRNTGVLDCQPVARAAGVRTGLHGYHGWDVDDLHGQDPRRNRLRRLCDPFVRHYVAVSRQIESWMTGTLGIDPGRISRICNGVDTGRFRPAQPPEAEFVIGTVGRLQAVKNQALLLEAFARLLADRPAERARLRLALIGDGPERGRLERMAVEAGMADRVDFAGWNDDVAASLASLSVFVLPSLNEGISNTVLEAMACGLPVVATAVGGTPELVSNGETGFLVDSGDVAGMAGRLAAYLDSPGLRQRHGTAARGRACHEFSIERMVADYDTLYRRLLGPRQAG